MEISIKDESDNKFNYWLFTNLIPSCKNLIYLSLSMYNNFYIDSKIFEFINTFKSLKTLKLENIQFDIDGFKLRINTLNSLSLYFVKNIQIEKSVYLTLKSLSFANSEIIDNNKEGKNNLLPELEDQYFGFNYIDLEKNLFNFQSLKQLKRFNGRNRYFL